MERGPDLLVRAGASIRQITDLRETERSTFGDLSDFFNPYLRRFARDTVRGRGQVWVSETGSSVDGLLCYSPAEKVGSIFTRDHSVAQALFALADFPAIFSDFPLTARSERFHILSIELPQGLQPHRFTHPVRLARATDQPSIFRMLEEMYGPFDHVAFDPSLHAGEKCFLVEIEEEIAGVGWVSREDGLGRLHSLSVRPRYRRLHVGTDVWHARMQWSLETGLRRVFSEVWENNTASLAIAEAGGMRRVGQIILSYRPGSGPPPPLRR
jgi:RimJ/RimL family protein N-acetyltransferase